MNVLSALVLPALVLPALLAASPWWENYTSTNTFLCRDRGRVVLERNDSQAALSSGGQRITLFRQSQEQAALIYGNEGMRVILRGDELTLEQLPRQVRCLRLEQV